MPAASRGVTTAIDAEEELRATTDNDTELRILEAGSACVARFGNEKTAIQDVADAAGVSRATVYRYFPDRATLLRAITRYENQRQLEEVRQRAASTTQLEDAVAIVVEVQAATALRYRTHEHLRNRDRGLAQYLLLERSFAMEPLREMVRPYVERARDAGELDPELGVDEAVEWIVIAVAAIPALPDSPVVQADDPATLGRTFARRLCRGLVPPAARSARR